MDRRRLRNSYANMSAQFPYLELEYRQQKIEQAERENRRRKSYSLRDENTVEKDNVGSNDSWKYEDDSNVPEMLKKTPAKKNSYASFLLELKDKTFDTAALKYVEKPFFVEMAEMRNDPKAQEYQKATDLITAQKIQLNRDVMTTANYVNTLKSYDHNITGAVIGSAIGGAIGSVFPVLGTAIGGAIGTFVGLNTDYVIDALNAFRINQNDAQASKYKGITVRSLEVEDMVNQSIKNNNDKIKLAAIQELEDAKNTLDYANNSINTEVKQSLVNSANQRFLKALLNVRQYYGTQFDPINNREDINTLAKDKQDLTQSTTYFHTDYDLKLMSEVHGDIFSVTAKGVAQAGRLNDAYEYVTRKLFGEPHRNLTRDELEYAMYKHLRALDTKDPQKQNQQLNAFLKDLQQVKPHLDVRTKEEEAERDAIDKPSEYFSMRSQLGSQRIQNGESWANLDNILYTQVEQQGFSNSSWGKQLAATLLTASGAALQKSVIGSIPGSLLTAMGAGFQYEAGRDENNAEIIENVKLRLTKSLKGEYQGKDKTNVYDLIMKEARQDARFKNKTDDDILEAIALGKYDPCKSKYDQHIQNVINEEVIRARYGAGNLFDKDMAAVSQDAARDAVIWGSGVGSLAGKVVLKGTGRLGGKLLSAAEKPLAKSARYRLFRQTSKGVSQNVLDKAKYIWSKGGDISTYGNFGQAGYITGAIAKPTIALTEKAGEKFAKSQLGKTVLHNKYATDMALAADKVVQFGKKIPNVLLHNPAKKIAERTKFSLFQAEQFLKRQYDKVGKLAASALSEEIEEGKLYLNAQEWINNEDQNRVSSSLDIMMSDISKEFNLMTAALGVPLGQRWGIAAKDSELFENMAGGMLGGFSHGALTSVAAEGLSEVGNKLGLTTSIRDIDQMIETNAYLDNKAAIGRFEAAQEMSKKLRNFDYRSVMEEMDAFLQFNDRQRERGNDAVDKEFIDYQREFITKVAREYNNPITEQQAVKIKGGAAKKGSDEYDRFVAAKVVFKEVLDETRDASKDVENQIAELTRILSASNQDVEDDIENMLDGRLSELNSLILDLFKNADDELIQQSHMTKKERRKAGRQIRKQLREENKRQQEINRGESDIAADIALDSSVASNQKSEYKMSDRERVIYGKQLVTELISLTDYMNALDDASNISDTNNKHDVDYIKAKLNERLNELKKLIPADKVQHVLNNKLMYLDTMPDHQELYDAYQSRFAAHLDEDTAEMMLRALTGVGTLDRDFKLNWGLNNAKDVLDKIQESIDDKYELMDRVNREFQHRNYGQESNTEDNIRQTAANEELDEMLGSDEDLITEQIQTTEPEPAPVQPTVPTTPLNVTDPTVANVDDINNMIAQQEAAAVRSAIDTERENMRNAYYKSIEEKENASVVFSEDEMAAGKFKTGQKVAVVNKTTKDYQVYTVQSEGDIVDENGIFIVKDGKVVPEDQRRRIEEVRGKGQTVQQQQTLDQLKLQTEKDNKRIVGVTGHDYFVTLDDGSVIMAPRVHTIMGDKYEDSPEMDKTWPESEYNKNKNKILDLIQSNKLDELTDLVKTVDNYKLYLDQLNNNSSEEIKQYVANALAELITRQKPNTSVNVGQVVDELARMFFDTENILAFDYNTLTINPNVDGKSHLISEMMSEEVFNKIKEDFTKLSEEYSKLGYVLSTTRHTWIGTINVNGNYTTVAGETDIVAVDRDGNLHIIDVKSSKYSFKEGSEYFDQKKPLFGRNALRSTREQYTLQLSYYMTIIKSAMPNIQFAESPIELLPVIVSHSEKEVLTPKWIVDMFNGRNDEPQRVILTPDQNVVNQQVNTNEVLNEKESLVYNKASELKDKISVLEDEAANKNDQLTQKDDSLKNVLTNTIKNIRKLSNEIEKLQTQYEQLDDNVDGTVLDNMLSVLNDLNDQYLNAKQELDRLYSENITKQFETKETQPSPEEIANDYEFHNTQDPTLDSNVTYESDETTQQIVIPIQLSQEDEDGWYNYNTADRNNVNATRSDDADKIPLSSVTGNEDFSTNSITEVKHIETDRGVVIVVCDIKYDNRIYRNVRIQVAQNDEGVKFLSAVTKALEMKQDGESVTLQGMNRTAGLVDVIPIQDSPILQSKAISDNIDIYDISTESNQNIFGLAKLNKSGQVEVHAQGTTPGTTKIIYIFPKGKGIPGTYHIVIKPNNNNASIPTKPLVMPIYGSKLKDNDVEFLLDLLNSVSRYGSAENKYEHVMEDGSSFNIPLTYSDLISIFMPYGMSSSRNPATHVKIDGDKVVFTTYKKDGTLSQTSYNLTDPNLRSYIQTTVRFNLDQDKIDSRLGMSKNANHPFRQMATLFERHPEIKRLQLGNSSITFVKEDFVRPDGNKDGVSGLGWMARNEMIITNYGGINNPRFSYTQVSTVKTEDDSTKEIQNVVDTPEISETDFDPQDIQDIDEIFDESWNYIQSETNPSRKIENAKAKLKKMFGSRVHVEVAAQLASIFRDKEIPAGCVGAMINGAIGLQHNAKRGTEYHEAFHLVSRFLLPKRLRKRLYKELEKVFLRDEGVKALNKQISDNQDKKDKVDVKEYVLEEYGAELCRQYFNTVEDIDFKLTKIFDYIKDNINALREIGDYRLAVLFTLMRMRAFSLPGLRLSKSVSKQNEYWFNRAKYNRGSKSYFNILNDCMYDKMVKSLVYYIIKYYNVKPDGKNLVNVNISKESLETKAELKSGSGKVFKDKNGNPVALSVRDCILQSCMTKDENGKTVDTPTSLAIREMFDNYGEKGEGGVYDDVKRYFDELGIDYQEKYESEREDKLTSGDDFDNGSGSSDQNYDKASYETSRVTRATTGIRFYTSLIKNFGKFKEYKDPKTGKIIKKVEYEKNEFGLYEFMDSKDVLVTLLNKLHGVKSKNEMIQKIQELAQHDTLFYQLDQMLRTKLYQVVRKDGSVDYSAEQILTQFFNLISSSKNSFMRVQATRDKQNGNYNFSVEECGQNYEASQYRMEWGRMLTYGGTTLFERDSEGNIIAKKIGNHDGVSVLGSIFDRIAEIRKEFSDVKIAELKDHGKPTLKLKNPETGKLESCNVITEEGCDRVINTLCSMFNYIGIQFDAPEFRYMLSEKYGSKGYTTIQDLLYKFFQQTKKESIEQLYGSDRKLIRKNQDGTWTLNSVNNQIIPSGRGKAIPVENIFVNNSFVSELSEWKYKYQHSTSDLSVLIGGGKTYYEISENSTITDITDDLSLGRGIFQDLKKFCYNFTNITEGEVSRNIGSVVIKQIQEAIDRGEKIPNLQIRTLTQFKTDAFGDDGAGYFDISEKEDYASKCVILESGGLLFPTMSDKKTWVYITGIKLPGIDYSDGVVTDLGHEDVLNQLLEYAETERMCVEQTIQQLKTLPDKQKVANFHTGAKITDAKGESHTIANGTLFGALTGVWVNGKYESFTDQLDSNGNYISPEQNLAKAYSVFFTKTHEEKLNILKETLSHRVKNELKHLEDLGLIEKTSQNTYKNKGLNNQALAMIAAHKFGLSSSESANQFQIDNCVIDYVRDIVSKSIISIHEVERCYSGHPGFFKYKFNKNGKLINRHEDEFKRFGGLISTGINNNVDIENGPKDGKYTCAIVDNEMIQSPEIDFIVEKIATSEWKAALRQERMRNVTSKSDRKKIWKEISEMQLDDVKSELKSISETVYNIVDKKVKQETDSYRKNKEEGLKGIDVADGGAYISPEMTRWLLLMCGEYDNRVAKAFEILENPDKYDIITQQDAYALVTTKVIGAQKYTAYGQRLSEDNKTMIPYYNKMALFPVFKCIATGRFAKIYEQMLNNKDAEGNAKPIHMLMVNSAVKVGIQGSVEYTTSSEFKGFNTFDQDFKFLRKQFNTNPHHKEDQSMGTQMVKVALTSLIADKDYITEDGRVISGDKLLANIMDHINKLTDIGKLEFREKIYTDGKIDNKKLSEYLISQLSSRDADKSMIDALSAIPIKDGENNTIGWKLKHPLAAISRMGWLQSVLKSAIDKEMVEIHTYGNAFYQRSIWGMEGHGADYSSDENIANDINEGKELLMIIKDGPAKGAMECVLTIDYFADILKAAGLDKASFEEQKKALIEAGIIGKNAKANLIGYRIPTQAQSSIHALVCVDVLPVIQHNIILPKEFTKITGSDKQYQCSNQYNIKNLFNCWELLNQLRQSAAKSVFIFVYTERFND